MDENAVGKIVGISGPVVFSEVAEGATDLMMREIVYVGEKNLIGEVTHIKEKIASIQVYEDTLGLQREDPIYRTRQVLSVKLGPGLLGSLYDGLQRPLERMREETGPYVAPGIKASRLPKKNWFFDPKVSVNEPIGPGDVVGVVDENEIIDHKILVPPGVSGRVVSIADEGDYSLSDEIAKIGTGGEVTSLTMSHSWPAKRARTYRRKLPPSEPLITGQRILDTILPVCKGGTVTVGGGFGTGKTILQNQFLQYLNVDIVIYVGCGERGNEIADILQKIPELKDAETGLPIEKRTVVIANTSNMPVAAREASIYTGATIGEYYRDMGYDVALLVDSTTRWAEALRETSSRQEEMPAEEGYPPYLASRLANFYGRAGKVVCLGSEERIGSLSIIASVSPSGGDFSEPVTQKSTQMVRAFWALDPELAYKRRFPAVNINQSFSYYDEIVEPFWRDKIGPDWRQLKEKALKLYTEKTELERIVRLVGTGALSEEEKMTLRNAELLENGFLTQNALHPIDSYTSPSKQFQLLDLLIIFHEKCMESLKKSVPSTPIFESSLRDELKKLKVVPEKEMDESYWNMRARILAHFTRLQRIYR
jgi:V/A-type H+-transporting ATPase subunit A